MHRPDVVDYLRQNLSKFKVEDLRVQLRAEGVADADFEESLQEALKVPKTVKLKGAPAPRGRAARFALAAGLALALGVVVFALSQKQAAPPPPPEPAASTGGESGFVGHRGWVVRLPREYVGVTDFRDPGKAHEVVHFCRRGTDPTHFLDEGLFGQMGIVRLEVMPSQFSPNPAGIATLTSAVTRKTNSLGEKFILKNVQVAGLHGVQLNIQSPYPRVEAYLVGQRDLYFFFAGQEDEIWRDIVLSLRDAHAAN